MEALKVSVTPYLAEHDWQPGALLAKKVKSNIADCRALVVLSDNTVNSVYVHSESGWAIASQKLCDPACSAWDGRPAVGDDAPAEYIGFDFDRRRRGCPTPRR